MKTNRIFTRVYTLRGTYFLLLNPFVGLQSRLTHTLSSLSQNGTAVSRSKRVKMASQR